mgnify:CR=1 FL=1
MKDKKLEDTLEEMTDALRSTRESVERTNARVEEVIESIHDPEQRREIEDEARAEIAANPGFLDEVEKLTDKR